MKENKKAVFNKSKEIGILLCLLAFIITVLSVATGAHIEQGYNITVGSISERRFRATRMVVNEVATQRLIDDVVSRVNPLYMQDAQITANVLEDLRGFFEDVLQLINMQMPIFTPYQDPTQTANITIPLSDSNTQRLISMSNEMYNEFRSGVFEIMEAILRQGVSEDIDVSIQALMISNEMERYDWDEELENIARTIILIFIRPNLIFDAESTNTSREEAAAQVEPIVFLEGQNIVAEGEYIDEEIFAVLSALGFVSTGLEHSFIPIAGGIILTAIVFFLGVIYIYLYHKSILNKNQEMLLIFTLLVATVGVSRLLIHLPYQFVPISLFSILVAILLNVKLAIVLNIVVTTLSALIVGGNIEFYVFHIISGTILAIFSTYTIERNKIIIVGVIASLINATILLGMSLLFGTDYSVAVIDSMLHGAVSGSLTVILAVGSLPFWEAVFGIVTPIKLLDLTNPGSELLRRLTIEAPGTYHHSLIVANLAETAAYDIGASTILARVGAYYHDIGKLKEPLCFSENQMKNNIHDELSPLKSVQIIIGHVEHGILLANQYKLPKNVVDIIAQHHGDTMVKFFYYKAKKESPDVEINEADFRYQYDTPKTREAAIVMIADTVEAAVRSMIPSGKTMVEVEEFVKTLIKDKLDDGQLNDSGLSIKDLTTIRKSFMRVFKGMYHERIPYPEGKKPKEEIKEEDKSE